MKYILTIFALFLFSACTTVTKQDQTQYMPRPPIEEQLSDDYNKKIAVIIPEKVIRSYTKVIINSALAYVLRQDAKISVDVFLIGDENEKTLVNTLKKIENDGYKFAVAAFTLKGLNSIKNANSKMYFYIPTIHKSKANIQNDRIYFGSIDYSEQINELLKIANTKNIASFYDNSTLSNSLNYIVLEKIPNARTYEFIKDKKINFKSLIYSKGSLNGAAIFLNTPIVESAIISSQLRVYETRNIKLFSSQIGYNPTILSLSQVNDRTNLYIANSISNSDDSLSYINELLEQSIDYNWIAYATSVGVDYLYTEFMNKDAKRIFKEELKDNQVIYDIRIMRANGFGFRED